MKYRTESMPVLRGYPVDRVLMRPLPKRRRFKRRSDRNDMVWPVPNKGSHEADQRAQT